ncbi:hypothetical protein BC938DRAFT_483156 [Jimgerdemannia flammicorona]|uniref:Uncharacterized protein n=1 Tax=Jimgerdemannia flammicorona TaxID=994334 RepID=A0A433QCJ5_9FUNG|nr:hypothetical protein BC938DRAFT_483156 [Jimgerdemannia flammicorona]
MPTSNKAVTIETLKKYDRDVAGQAERFLAFIVVIIMRSCFAERIGSDFQLPESMPDFYRTYYVTAMGDEDPDAEPFEQREARNLLFFYNQLDAGAFDDFPDKWVLIDKETVIKITDEKDRDLGYEPDEEASAPISMPVDQSFSFKTKAARVSTQQAGSSRRQGRSAGTTKLMPKKVVIMTSF